MTSDHSGQLDGLSARANGEFQGLLNELQACGYQAHELLQRAGLPGMAQRPLFTLLGYISRADGRITERDIQFAESLMRAQDFGQRRRNMAITAFRRGKSLEKLPGSLGRRLRWLSVAWPGPALKVSLVLCNACQSQGRVSLERMRRCEEAIRFLGLPPDLPRVVMDAYRARSAGAGTRAGSGQGISYDEACRILGASPGDSFTVLKKAYRRSVGQYHPDRLDPDLTPAAKAAAKEQMLQLQAAWQRIRVRHQARS